MSALTHAAFQWVHCRMDSCYRVLATLQVEKLTSSVRDLGTELANTQAELKQTQQAMQHGEQAHSQAAKALQQENSTLKQTLEASALSLEEAHNAWQRLEQALSGKHQELQQVRCLPCLNACDGSPVQVHCSSMLSAAAQHMPASSMSCT